MKFRRPGVSISFSADRLALILLLLRADLISSESLFVRKLNFQGWRPGRDFQPGFAAGDTVTEEQLADARSRILRRLTSEGYLRATVDLLTAFDSSGVSLTFQVYPGPRMRITGWQLEGTESLDTTTLYRRLNLPRKQPFFSHSQLFHTISRLQQTYHNLGFPFARIEFTGIVETAGGVKPVLQIAEGPKVKISFVSFAGSPELNREMLRRYSGFSGPVDYQPSRIRTWQSNLQSSGWLKVDSIDIVRQESVFGIRFWLTPAKTGQLDAALGYLPETRQLTGWFTISLFNLFNRGRAAEFHWRSAYKRTDYKLNYTEPWPFNLPFTLTGEISHKVSDTVYAYTLLGVTAVTGRDELRLKFNTGYNHLAGVMQKNGFWAGTGFQYDHRDDIDRYRRGIFLELTTRGGYQSIPPETTGFAGEVSARWCAAIPLYANMALTDEVYLHMIYSELPLAAPELYAVGGPENIRGYREGEFTTDQLFWSNFEPRLYLTRHSRVHIFFDAGVLHTSERAYQIIAGYGCGGRWETNFGILGIDFGIPFPQSPMRAKIHLNYRTGF
ncbi:MAG: BamA/TamA family outer membrane protein [candidate division WOR-3 bacterium]|uniref:Bacterial surface antigen (D15) domain-containing protein n=1 Tax=candidate division WOR-3 bacterium TaxID=2052148 RepID=A0A7C1SWR9_UNCW3|nr:BamA/TamA family outer membrane protein [candidate division WOR-3 bacterium]